MRILSLFLLFSVGTLQAAPLITINNVDGGVFMADAVDIDILTNEIYFSSQVRQNLRGEIEFVPFDPGNPPAPLPPFTPELPFTKNLEIQSTNLSSQMDVDLQNDSNGASFSVHTELNTTNNVNPPGGERFTIGGRDGITSNFLIEFTAEQDSIFSINASTSLDYLTTLPTVNELFPEQMAAIHGPDTSTHPILPSSYFNQIMTFGLLVYDEDADYGARNLFSNDFDLSNNGEGGLGVQQGQFSSEPNTFSDNLIAGKDYVLSMYLWSHASNIIVPIPDAYPDEYELAMASIANIQFTVTAVPLPPAFVLLLFALSSLKLFSRK